MAQAAEAHRLCSCQPRAVTDWTIIASVISLPQNRIPTVLVAIRCAHSVQFELIWPQVLLQPFFARGGGQAKSGETKDPPVETSGALRISTVRLASINGVAGARCSATTGRLQLGQRPMVREWSGIRQSPRIRPVAKCCRRDRLQISAFQS